jgi:sigma-B regulation protein RsbU (phosphoserine phosphatase)
MNHPILYGILAVALVVLATMTVRLRRKVRRKKADLAAFEGEEARMFEFLHNLGAAISEDTGRTGLYRTIVDGLDEVVEARGGALYLLDESGAMLQPKYLSENCPPLVGVPLEVRRQAEQDPRAMDSYLRLSQVPADEGVLGGALSAGRALRVDDLRSHESFRDAFLGFGGGEVAALVAPLRHAGKDLGVLAVARLREDGPFSSNDFAVFRSAAEQSGFALGNALVWQEADERRHFETEIRNAREVQRVLLPKADAEVPGFRIFSTNLPARLISGDYHDHLELGEGKHGIVIADVSGKGVPAGLIMAMCRSVLRCHAGLHEDPATLIAAVNRQLFPDIREDMFISLFYGVLTENDNRVRLVRAGHDPLLWFRAATGEVEEIKPRGLALGIDSGRVFERVTQVA